MHKTCRRESLDESAQIKICYTVAANVILDLWFAVVISIMLLVYIIHTCILF